ncbi:MAG: hypothetical protein U0938_14060 [Thiobacillus sp.]|nr:hypothetical protein [Thiobacillus sp.]
MAHAAEKLRRQCSVAGAVQVYIRTNPFNESHPQYQRGIQRAALIKLIPQAGQQHFSGLRAVVLGQGFPSLRLGGLHPRQHICRIQRARGRSPPRRPAWLLTLYPKVYPLGQRLYNHGVPLAGARCTASRGRRGVGKSRTQS